VDVVSKKKILFAVSLKYFVITRMLQPLIHISILIDRSQISLSLSLSLSLSRLIADEEGLSITYGVVCELPQEAEQEG